MSIREGRFLTCLICLFLFSCSTGSNNSEANQSHQFLELLYAEKYSEARRLLYQTNHASSDNFEMYQINRLLHQYGFPSLKDAKVLNGEEGSGEVIVRYFLKPEPKTLKKTEFENMRIEIGFNKKYTDKIVHFYFIEK